MPASDTPDMNGAGDSLLVADVGGTNSRLAIAHGNELHDIEKFTNAGFSNFSAVLEQYLEGANEQPGRALVAVAGPVSRDSATLTNLGWSIHASDLAGIGNLGEASLVNDFEAMAWATAALDENDLLAIGSAKQDPAGNRVVLGPGTGLGVAGMVRTDNHWVPVPGEGGHMSMASRTPDEARIINNAAAEFGHCSAERLLSGNGLTRIARELTGSALPPEAITAALLEGDADAVDVMHVFTGLLATVASDLALTFNATGGIYIGGGILPRVADWFAESEFRSRFDDKGRHSELLKSMPVYLITGEVPALKGLAYAARYAINN